MVTGNHCYQMQCVICSYCINHSSRKLMKRTWASFGWGECVRWNRILLKKWCLKCTLIVVWILDKWLDADWTRSIIYLFLSCNLHVKFVIRIRTNHGEQNQCKHNEARANWQEQETNTQWNFMHIIVDSIYLPSLSWMTAVLLWWKEKKGREQV